MQDLFLAGFFAASGSLFGKLSGGECLVLECEYKIVTNKQSLLFLQAFFLVSMIVCNVLNWRYFLKAIQSTEQTLTATVMSTASNYIFSFLFGICFFGESISLLSILGTTSIMVGLCFLCT